MWPNDLRDSIENAFTGGEPPRVIEIRYWSAEDIAKLVKLAVAQATTRQIALELGRTPLAVRLKASRMGLPLTGHEVRRSAKRHAKRQGKAAAAEVKSLRKPPRITMTVDFDLSSLTRHERRQLAERLRTMEMQEGVVLGEAPPAELPVLSARRPLRVHAPYDPSTATSERLRKANARRSEKREALGWTRRRQRDDDELPLADEEREAMRGLRRRLRSAKQRKRVPLERLEMEELMNDPVVRSRMDALDDGLEDGLDDGLEETGASRYEPPKEDAYAKYRRYLRGE